MKLLLSPSESITELGGPLVQIRDDGTVVLPHQIMKEYLLSSQAPELRISPQIAIPISPTESNSLVTSICLTYLSFPCFNLTYNFASTTQHGLLQYAACHWYLHAVRTGKRLSIFRSVANFLYSQQGFNWLDGLQRVFHKSIGDLLVIQSKVRQWAQQFDQTDVPQVDDLILALYRRKFEEGRKAFSNSKKRLKFIERFADISQATGHMDQAERLYKEVLGKTSLTMSGGPRSQLKHGVVSTSVSEARWKGQEKSKTHLLHVSDANFGLEYPLSLSSKASLAMVYQNQGRWKEAENLNTEVVELRRKILGPEHPDTLISVSNLGSNYRYQGRWIEAEGLEIEVIETLKRVLGLKHPSTLASMNNLAEVLISQGKYEEARRIHQKVLELRVTVLSKEHPDTLLSMNNLAMVLGSQGKYDEAEKMHQQALTIMESVLGTEHPDTLSSMNNLGINYKDQGKLAEAEQIFRRALDGQEKAWGPEHTFTLNTVNNLGLLYQDQGKLAEAEVMIRRASEGLKKLRGPNYPSTTLIHDNLNSLAG